MPSRIRGVVLNGADGRTPLSGIVVEAFNPGTGAVGLVTDTTDANGEFSVSGLTDETWVIRRVSGGAASSYLIQQVKEQWVEDELHGQRTTLSAHGHGQLRDITPNDHHSQSHVLATSTALGGDHTVSGLTVGHVLTALTATTAAFQAAGSGTVTSVDVSGGTTGLTTSGGPITTSGTITLAGTLVVGNGGTGITTLASGNLALGAGSSAFTALAPGASGGYARSDGSTWSRSAILAGDVPDLSATYQPLDADLTQIAAVANVRGDLLVSDATPAWIRLGLGAGNRVLFSDGLDPSWQDYLVLGERSAPSAPATNSAAVYMRSNGGFTELVMLGSSGEECVICTVSDFVHVNTMLFDGIE